MRFRFRRSRRSRKAYPGKRTGTGFDQHGHRFYIRTTRKGSYRSPS